MIEFSWRYGVIGVYRDRSVDLWRIYPVPFVRVTLDFSCPAHDPQEGDTAPYPTREAPRVSGGPRCEHGYSTCDVGGIPIHIGTGKLCGGGNPNLATEESPGGEVQ